MLDRQLFVVALGGIGGDAHSVGLTILRQALLAHGYVVRFLGPQAGLEEFFAHERLCHAILVSSMDGHAPHYLRPYAELRARLPPPTPARLWYLGGNLGAGDTDAAVRAFLALGFDRVFPSYAPLEEVLACVSSDLELRASRFEVPPDAAAVPRLVSPAEEGTSAGELSWEGLMDARPGVLRQWPTGAAATDMDDSARFLSRCPQWADAQRHVDQDHSPMLVQPRSGVALPRAQFELFRGLKMHGASVLSFQIDSLTRNNDHLAVQEILTELQSDNRSDPGDERLARTLNGYPMVNHGVNQLRRIVSSIELPLQTRHSTRDPRLLAEISFSGGITSFEGGPISYNIPYFRRYPLEESLRAWRYVDRLAAEYKARYGLVLDREFFGTLTATLVPPSLAIAVDLLELMLAVEQGVRSVSLGYAEQGNRTQDVAACRTLRAMAEALLRNLGFRDVAVSVVFHQYMGAFPRDARKAADLIRASATTAVVAGATRVVTKTPAEAFGVPSLRDNLDGLNLVREGADQARHVAIDTGKVEAEAEVIRRETQVFLDAVLDAGDGSVGQGIPTAFRRGVLDIPFAPSILNRGEVMTARDAAGAVRYAAFGQLPFGRDLREFNREMLASRARYRRRVMAPHELVQEDVLMIPRGAYEAWPLDAAQ